MKDFWASAGHTAKKLWSDDRFFGAILIAPLLIWLAVILVYPFMSVIWLGFTNAGVIGGRQEFIGLENYRYLLSNPEFWDSLGKTAIWALGNALVQTILGLALALSLNRPFRGQGVIRNWIILPWIVPTVTTVVMWRWMLSGSFGVVNYVLVKLGVIEEMISFLGQANVAMPAVTLINSWRWFPFITIIFLAGLQRIPKSEHEASLVDGASASQRFRFVTFPYLKPIMLLMGLLGILWSVNTFDVIWLSTQGGPGSATETLALLIYDVGFKRLQMGRGAALSVLFFLIMIGFSVLYAYLNLRKDAGIFREPE